MSGNEPLVPVLVDARPLVKASALHLLAWSVLAGVLLLAGPVIARSVWIGAVIAVLPTAWVSWSVFRIRKGAAPRDAAQAVYRGALNKLLLTSLLFALAFAEAQPLHAAALFSTFVAALVIQHWLVARFVLRT